MSDLLRLPKFETEAEEAQWWFDNQGLIEEAFDAAAKSGRLRRNMLANRLARSKASQVPIVLNATDAALAGKLVAKRGESYGDFVRGVVHRALELEKKA